MNSSTSQLPKARNEAQSPFLPKDEVRLSFNTMLLLLLMVVSAGVALLIYYALRVPAITSELNAWLGRPDQIADRGESRRAQVTFALFLYTAPLALGLLVHLMHFAVNWLGKVTRPKAQSDEAEYRME